MGFYFVAIFHCFFCFKFKVSGWLTLALNPLSNYFVSGYRSCSKPYLLSYVYHLLSQYSLLILSQYSLLINLSSPFLLFRIAIWNFNTNRLFLNSGIFASQRMCLSYLSIYQKPVRLKAQWQ